MANGAMVKSFKSVEEFIEYLKDAANIETLDNGEVTLKDWTELGNLYEQYKKNYDLSLKDKKTLQSQKGELSKQVATLTEQLDTVNNELEGLKKVHVSDDKEAIQKLNKEKSELLAKFNASESKLRDFEKQVALIPEMEKQIEGFKAESNRSRILDAVRKAAVQKNVPQNIIDDPDIMRIVADNFTIDESGGIFTVGDTPQSVDNYIASQQKDKTHWNPASMGGSGANPIQSGGNSGGAITDDHGALVGLLS